MTPRHAGPPGGPRCTSWDVGADPPATVISEKTEMSKKLEIMEKVPRIHYGCF